jgi:hypothetical protein
MRQQITPAVTVGTAPAHNEYFWISTNGTYLSKEAEETFAQFTSI